MPTYTTLETLSEVMQEHGINHWKVHDEDGQLMQHLKPAISVPWRDSYNTLEKFLTRLDGSNFVKVTLFTPGFKGDKGGDTASTVFKYFYKLTSSLPAKQSIGGLPGAGQMDLFGLFMQIQELKVQLANQTKDAEIEGLKRELRENKKENKGYFETAAEAMGGAMMEKFMELQGVKPAKKSTTKKSQAINSAEDTPGKRGAAAIKRLVSVGGLGVIDGLEQMAAMAEQDPQQLLAVINSIKPAEAEEEEEVEDTKPQTKAPAKKAAAKKK